MTHREFIIKNYIDAYNRFDVSKMVADFSDEVVFENIQNGERTMRIRGIEAFKNQAEEAKTYFSEREQKILSFKHHIDRTEVEIEYRAVLAIDLPNGMQQGMELKLNGRSVFQFRDEKIIGLTDMS